MVEFLNAYMKKETESADPAIEHKRSVFTNTFKHLAAAFPNGITRGGPKRGTTTPLLLFEGVAVGAALALKKAEQLHTQNIADWMDSP